MQEGEEMPQGEGIALAEAVRFQRDLYLYWRVAHALGGLPLTTRRFVARPAVRRIRVRLRACAPGASAMLNVEEDAAEGVDLRLFYLRRLLERLGLLRVSEDGTRLLAGDEREMARYLAHPLAERLRICARLWVAGGWWPDHPDAEGEPPRVLAPAPPRLALMRRHLLEALATRALGEQVAVPLAPLTSTTLARTRPRAARLGSAPRRARVAEGVEGESATWRAALLGPLAWMGFVEREQPQTHECRVGVAVAALQPDTEWAAALLPETPGRVLVQANLDVVAYPPLTAPALLTLDTAAEEVALDTLARYRLTRAALMRGAQGNGRAALVAARLEALTGAPLPPNVRTTLDDWARFGERVRLAEQVDILEVRAPALLDALLADRAAGGWVERRLTPTVALLRQDAVLLVRGWLLRRGELPALVRPPGATDSPDATAPSDTVEG